jgi:hypothetical protein
MNRTTNRTANRTIRIIVAALAAPLAMLAATASIAQEVQRPNYKYIELDYVYASAEAQSNSLNDQANEDTWYVPSGAAIKGSWVFAEQLLLRGSYYGGKGEWKKYSDVNISSAIVSAGWLIPTTDATGIDISLDYREDTVEFKGAPSNSLDNTISGVGVSFGVRAAPTANTEIGVRGGWYEGDWNGGIGFGLNFAYNFSERWGVNLSWDRIDADPKDSVDITKYELNQFGLGARLYF